MNFSIKITKASGLLFAILIPCLLLIGCQKQPSVLDDAFSTTKSQADVAHIVHTTDSAQIKLNRMASCYASLCHGQQTSSQHNASSASCSLNEAVLWSRFDPHVFSYESLKSQLSKQMMEKLNDPVAAHQNSRCLSCHAPQLIDAETETASFSKSECLMCHGTQLAWVDEHMNWQNFSAEDKKEAYARTGMRELKHHADRIELCLGCHVGSPAESSAIDGSSMVAKEVDHDLIAAGHPRLDFHYGPFRDAMQPHWDHEVINKQNENLLSLWVVSQWYGMKARVQLLYSRIEPNSDSKFWPEFAEVSCFSCHHDLNTNVNVFQGTASKQGAIWENSYRFFFPDMVRHLVKPNVNNDQSEKLESFLVQLKCIEDSFQLTRLSRVKNLHQELSEIINVFDDPEIDTEIRKIASINLNQSEINSFLDAIKSNEKKQEQLNTSDWHRSISTLLLLREIGVQYGKENPQWNAYLAKVKALESQFDFSHRQDNLQHKTVSYLYNSPKKVPEHSEENYQNYFAKQKQYYDLIRMIPQIP